MSLLFMAAYVVMLVVGIIVGIWIYKRDIAGNYGRMSTGRKVMEDVGQESGEGEDEVLEKEDSL